MLPLPPIRSGHDSSKSFSFKPCASRASGTGTRDEQLRSGIRALEWKDTRGHDDLVWVSAEGKTRLERLCHEECAKEFPKEQTEWD